MDQLKMMHTIKVLSGYIMDLANGMGMDPQISKNIAQECLNIYQEYDQAIRVEQKNRGRG